MPHRRVYALLVSAGSTTSSFGEQVFWNREPCITCHPNMVLFIKGAARLPAEVPVHQAISIFCCFTQVPFQQARWSAGKLYSAGVLTQGVLTSSRLAAPADCHCWLGAKQIDVDFCLCC